jgi:predicted acetylornithine/succinylornithine family transaminase
MDIKRAIGDTEHYLMQTYARLPAMLVKGRGTKVWGSDGKEYLDFVGGVATNVLGHCYPKVVVALQKQAQRLMHVSNWYHIEPQLKLAKILVQNSFADKVFFCNSGTEAVEGAIKLARKYASRKKGSNCTEIITALNSFHGRTMGALSATGQEKLRKGFGPALPGFSHVPFGDADEVGKAITPETCAVLLEPIQGESGVRIPPPDYLNQVRRICSERGVLLILDEIQTGMGRTGKLFAYEHSGITPDIMALAKGLGAGMPIGAVLATDTVASAFGPGDHGSTFGGNPLATAAGIATMDALLEGGLILDQCRRMGAYLLNRVQGVARKHSDIAVETRGAGLLVGLELNRECAPVISSCLERGLLINCAANKVIRMMPPLIVQEEEIDSAMGILDEALSRLI